MDFDIAEQMERFVKLLETHPVASLCALVALLLVLGFQKDGLFSRGLSYLEARAIAESDKEERRLEILRMLESRNQLSLPGFGENDEEKKQ